FAYMENPDKCIGCGNCAIVCPDTVITVYKVKI
ncbi:MAG: 4Fe-4S binding protein, partial [Bacteroidales bacterium]|nr:4Fe-4S binding protein [Bacteroidales bacterium]